jgi:transcriptional regulator with XRE-family HTH domain
MMSYEEIREALKDRVLQRVAEKTGLNPMTINKIANGKTKKPHKVVQRALSDYLQNTNWSINDKQE